MIETLNLWQFVGGLGIFLFAMAFIEDSLVELSGRRLKRFFREYTKTPIRGIFVGTFSTAILQSSSVVTLMVLSFVGAGVINMPSALGVILGSNLGTTFTGWIVATFGFEVDVQAFAFPLIGVGALLYTLLPKYKLSTQFFKFLAGLGLLFLGLVFMKSAMQSFSQSFDVETLKGYHFLSFFAFGFVFTAIIQSSSATMMITLTALNAGIVDLPGAAALVIGADLGTTITALLGSIGGSVAKKQTSMAHFTFNVVTDLLALALIKPLLWFVLFVFGEQEPLYSLVLFHSSFNLIGILLFLPFTGLFSRFLQFVVKEGESLQTSFINKVPVAVPEAAVEALNSEMQNVFARAVNCNKEALLLKESEKGFSHTYEDLKELTSEILSYLFRVQEQNVSESDAIRLNQILKAIDAFNSSVKAAKDIHHDIRKFENSGRDSIIALQKAFDTVAIRFYEAVQDIQEFENLSHVFEEIVKLKDFNDQEFQRMQTLIFDFVKNDGLKESDVTTLLNMNRELHASCKNLLTGLAETRLPKAKSEEI